ncbi:vacuolar iron transporter 4-like [Pyrus ussuriensis x Pyrus communis]|uniref:Vacuolar iron transporter n=1 Tax=Pyrus ussuriensis x Pyrus communis TaxID=2448454 RepID=A0A5N5I6T4_9ROSA|nr:vacuolar iron transporter 4-like [Pyrus ussuriensis x Pyrus communis]
MDTSHQTLETPVEHKLPVTDDENYTKTEQAQRAQWLRAALLGASGGLLSTTSLMLGVGAAKVDRWTMILSGIAGAVAGACSMAVGEFVSVSTRRYRKDFSFKTEHEGEESLPSPHKAASASALAFLCGSLVPLLSAVFIPQNTIRIAVVVMVASIALAFFGGVGARMGGSPAMPYAFRVLVGGWLPWQSLTACFMPYEKKSPNEKD